MNLRKQKSPKSSTIKFNQGALRPFKLNFDIEPNMLPKSRVDQTELSERKTQMYSPRSQKKNYNIQTSSFPTMKQTKNKELKQFTLRKGEAKTCNLFSCLDVTEDKRVFVVSPGKIRKS